MYFLTFFILKNKKLLSKIVLKILRVCLVPAFKNCFLFLKTKNTKNLFGERDAFLFFVFSIFSKTTFLIIIKKCFYCFFTIQIIYCFFVFSLPSFCVFLAVFYVSTKVSSTQPPHPHPQTFSSSLNY